MLRIVFVLKIIVILLLTIGLFGCTHISTNNLTNNNQAVYRDAISFEFDIAFIDDINIDLKYDLADTLIDDIDKSIIEFSKIESIRTHFVGIQEKVKKVKKSYENLSYKDRKNLVSNIKLELVKESIIKNIDGKCLNKFTGDYRLPTNFTRTNYNPPRDTCVKVIKMTDKDSNYIELEFRQDYYSFRERIIKLIHTERIFIDVDSKNNRIILNNMNNTNKIVNIEYLPNSIKSIDLKSIDDFIKSQLVQEYWKKYGENISSIRNEYEKYIKNLNSMYLVCSDEIIKNNKLMQVLLKLNTSFLESADGYKISKLSLENYKNIQYLNFIITNRITFNNINIKLNETNKIAKYIFNTQISNFLHKSSNLNEILSQVKGVKFTILASEKNFINEKDFDTKKYEFYLKSDDIKRYIDDDITSQDLINLSTIKIEDGRVKLIL